jgi:hypothetical protein
MWVVLSSNQAPPCSALGSGNERRNGGAGLQLSSTNVNTVALVSSIWRACWSNNRVCAISHNIATAWLRQLQRKEPSRAPC